MHSISVSVRLMALLAVAIVAVLAFASLSPGTSDKASAVDFSDLTSISCSDVYLDLGDVATLGDPPDIAGGEFIVVKALTRLDAAQPAATDEYDATQILYFGPDDVEGKDPT
ncbi:MAG: hypothetical protein IIC26_08290, partial [Chloroflexi bacterium]|nr:hypothetical protein [Chloroflexota bacterium]